jgi:hypothetical protein
MKLNTPSARSSDRVKELKVPFRLPPIRLHYRWGYCCAVGCVFGALGFPAYPLAYPVMCLPQPSL